ncbi:MAG: PPE domain-containing protein [Actinomycetota bacterium]|uniref:PPE domain-containing protein n=1 Tax=Mycobacterium lentiflavum TaxID=141349 RepID=A0ABY3UUA3_MYCLN|nr:PPE domain-containing protein [Mycobacterium lentiflavum]MEE3065130.1 PPE domain-containing protein [Actinomycetota bacterium]ULP42204.1 PPE domain-containing protein [Mycobacterium lentiflavum]
MDFATIPPEFNSGRLYSGPGSGSMLAAALAWDGLAAELHTAAAGYASVIAGLVAGPWLGFAAASMAAAAAPYVTWMRTAAAQAEQTATQAKAAAAAYEVAFAAVVPPPVIAANRTTLKALVATNIFGQNTPAIAVTETHYAEMWAQDAAAMYGYAALSASASTLAPFTQSPQSTRDGGARDQAAALARATATSAATDTQAALVQLSSDVPATLQALASSPTSTAAAVSPVSGIFDALQSLGLISPSTFFEPASLGVATSELGTASGAWADAAKADTEIEAAGREIAEDQDALTRQISGAETRIMSRFDQLGTIGEAGSAGLGQAATIGALSVPPGWTTAAPQIRLATLALPATSLGAVPDVLATSQASLFGEMTLASMAGQAINGTVSPARRERVGAPARASSGSSPSAGGQMSGIASEMREFAELLGKLGDLRDSGLLTDEEFDEQKQRLLGRLR